MASSLLTVAGGTCSSTTVRSPARASSRWSRGRRWSSTAPRVRRDRRRRTYSLSRSGGNSERAAPVAPRSALPGGEMAEKEEKIEFEGEVLESFRSGMYRVGLDNGHQTLAYTSGKMRRYRIRINPGDRVRVELSPYDLDRGRIVYRNK